MSAQARPDPARLRTQRDTALLRLRSLNAGMVVAGVAAIGVASAGVAIAAPSHHSAAATRGESTTESTSESDNESDNRSTTQQASPQQSSPNNNAPVATSAGS
jgi:hypothetical protein